MSLHGSFLDTDFGGRDSGFGSGGLGPLAGNAINNQANPGFGDTIGDAAGGGIFGSGSVFGKGGAASIALGGIQSLGSLWNSFQQQKLAKKQFNFQKNAFETNLANQTQVYNTALEDRIRARFATEGKTEAAATTKIEENKL